MNQYIKIFIILVIIFFISFVFYSLNCSSKTFEKELEMLINEKFDVNSYNSLIIEKTTNSSYSAKKDKDKKKIGELINYLNTLKLVRIKKFTENTSMSYYIFIRNSENQGYINILIDSDKYLTINYKKNNYRTHKLYKIYNNEIDLKYLDSLFESLELDL